MMYAVELDHVSKIHPINAARARSVKNLLLSVFRRRVETETVTAVDDVSLAVETGSSTGIIGSNGAGKSSILKLIAGIAEPTSGNVRTNGLVLPMLELGAGFHPDLSGYDNIYLQGHLLGLSRERIDALLPSIIEFSEIDKYIHMPVRHYSSGMYVRLGFSISLHVNPDILLIDEAFSVGDLYFQRKCMDRVIQFRERGGTLVLVTHDIGLVEKVCDEAIWIDKGRIVERGSPADVAHHYKKTAFQRVFERPTPLLSFTQFIEAREGRYGTGAVTFDYLDLCGDDGQPRNCFRGDDALTIRMKYHAHRPMDFVDCFIVIHDETTGLGAICIFSPELGGRLPVNPEGGEYAFPLGRLDLSPGRYFMTALLYTYENYTLTDYYDIHSKAYNFTVLGDPHKSGVGILDVPVEWSVAPKAK
jgi:lipopolysaccharide transport system ATP-binding protein